MDQKAASVLPSCVASSVVAFVSVLMALHLKKQTLPLVYERSRDVLRRGSQFPRLRIGQIWVGQLPRKSLFCFVLFLFYIFAFFFFF